MCANYYNIMYASHTIDDDDANQAYTFVFTRIRSGYRTETILNLHSMTLSCQTLI